MRRKAVAECKFVDICAEKLGGRVRSNYDLVIFDLDGTLIDSRRDLAYSVNFTRRQLGLPLLSQDRG